MDTFVRGISSIAVSVMVLFTTQAAYGQQNMPRHLHTMLSLLEQGKIVFAGLDYTFIDMEHPPFDVTALRIRVLENLEPEKFRKGEPAHTILVRIPAYGRELDKNHWQVKQVLDAGVQSIVFPTIESVAQAQEAIKAMRYPQKAGSKDFDPPGLRGTGPTFAARVWGLSQPEYIEKADLWKLDPGGQLIPWLLIESPAGAAASRDICRWLKEKNIGAVVWVGTGGGPTGTGGDMLATHGGSMEAVSKSVDTVLAAGREFGCTIAMVGNAQIERRIQEGARIFSGNPSPSDLKAAGR
jgi:4-hydroxy-2-oxoheptanedioate aldolase